MLLFRIGNNGAWVMKIDNVAFASFSLFFLKSVWIQVINYLLTTTCVTICFCLTLFLIPNCPVLFTQPIFMIDIYLDQLRCTSKCSDWILATEHNVDIGHIRLCFLFLQGWSIFRSTLISWIGLCQNVNEYQMIIIMLTVSKYCISCSWKWNNEWLKIINKCIFHLTAFAY